MKKLLFKALVLVLLTGAAGVGEASANTSVYIRVGSPPPPVRYQRQWVEPYRGAVWIPAHNEWRNGRYVWVSGYYTYPPRSGARWVGPTYQHAPNGYFYRPGYWR